ncbi:hypothetical protein BC827DRAFT_1169579, partial [Russula dissimulans]
MTSVLHPRSHSFTSRSPSGGGILLNPSPYGRLSALPQPSYPSRSNQSLSSSTSSSEDVNTPPSSVHATPLPSLGNSVSLPYISGEDRIVRSRSGSGGASGSRRIRFAPLPDPRRAVLVTEHGEELPLPSVFDDDDPGGIPNPKLRDLYTSPHSSLLLGDGAVTPREVPTIVTSGPSLPVQTSRPSPPSPARITESPTPSTATITSAALFPTASSSRLARRLFYPFLQKGGDSRRSDSRDSSSSRDDSPTSLGTPLGHWRSADESFHSTSTNPEPLFRARSATSTAQPQPKRMLNGRMYGARKHLHQSTNVFSNIPDEEPEFVEWGYGGMGSVNAGGMWAKVQSDQKLFIGHDEERGRRGAPQSSLDDDGGGMGWVRRRREERERKRLEEEAARKAASKSDDDPAFTLHSAPVPIPASTTTHVPALVLVDHNIRTVMPSQPPHELDDESSDESDEEVDDESVGTEQEDDDADQEQHFKQVLGAGVERVSRHR